MSDVCAGDLALTRIDLVGKKKDSLIPAITPSSYTRSTTTSANILLEILSIRLSAPTLNVHMEHVSLQYSERNHGQMYTILLSIQVPLRSVHQKSLRPCSSSFTGRPLPNLVPPHFYCIYHEINFYCVLSKAAKRKLAAKNIRCGFWRTRQTRSVQGYGMMVLLLILHIVDSRVSMAIQRSEPILRLYSAF